MTKIVNIADSVTISQATATLRRDGNCHAAGAAARGREALLSIGSSSCLLVLPVRVFRVFQVPERAAAAHGHLTSCPAEKSGQEEFDFEYGEDFATHRGVSADVLQGVGALQPGERSSAEPAAGGPLAPTVRLSARE